MVLHVSLGIKNGSEASTRLNEEDGCDRLVMYATGPGGGTVVWVPPAHPLYTELWELKMSMQLKLVWSLKTSVPPSPRIMFCFLKRDS